MQNKKSILIVDDDKMLASVIQLLLEEYGHTVSCCDNGVDAVNLSKEHDFDMILIDYNMPGLKGDSVCRLIRYNRPDVYIMGFSSEYKGQAFAEAGANKFLYKVDLAQNLSLLHQLVLMTP